MSEGVFSKYTNGIPIPEVAVRVLLSVFQFIETVQSEKSETVVFSLLSPSNPITIGDESPITPHGMYVIINP